MAAGMSTHTLDTHAVMMMAMKRRSSWYCGERGIMGGRKEKRGIRKVKGK